MNTAKHTLLLFIKPWWLGKLRNTWKYDLIAGLSVAVVAVPQSMGYAQLAGVPAYYGLYAVILPTIVAAYFGTSRYISTGPTAIIAILTATTIGVFEVQGTTEYIGLVATLALLVGLIQLALGLLKLGSLIRYVARPVVAGFVSAAAIIIILSQIHLLIGIVSDGHTVYDRLIAILLSFGSVHIASLLFGVGSLLAIVIIKHFYPRLPGVLIVVTLSILLSWALSFSGAIVGQIPSSIPTLSIPSDFYAIIPRLFISALVIAVVGYMEGFSVIKSLSVKKHDKIMPNKEMIAQGLANVTAGASSTMPVAASVSRTALTYATGAKTNFASIVLGLSALLALVLFTPVFTYLPIATLAAVIIVAVMHLIDIEGLITLSKTYPSDGVIALFTFFATIAFAPHIDYGILVGIAVSVLALLYKNANPRVTFFWLGETKKRESNYFAVKNHPYNKYIGVISWDASLTFVNAGTFEDSMYKTAHLPHRIRYIILLSQGINSVDATGEESLKNAIEYLHSKHISLYIVGLTPVVRYKLEENGMAKYINKKTVFPNVHNVLRAIYSKEEQSKK